MFWGMLSLKFTTKETLEDKFLVANPHISNLVMILTDMLLSR
jgi:hypothetical protein